MREPSTPDGFGAEPLSIRLCDVVGGTQYTVDAEMGPTDEESFSGQLTSG